MRAQKFKTCIGIYECYTGEDLSRVRFKDPVELEHLLEKFVNRVRACKLQGISITISVHLVVKNNQAVFLSLPLWPHPLGSTPTLSSFLINAAFWISISAAALYGTYTYIAIRASSITISAASITIQPPPNTSTNTKHRNLCFLVKFSPTLVLPP